MRPTSGEYAVFRHGGRENTPWHRVAGFASEAAARERYGRELVKMRQGGLELRGPGGEIVESAWAPRLHSRW